jgi:hypothetical protein
LPNQKCFDNSNSNFDFPNHCLRQIVAETMIEKISGIHDLYLVLFGKTGIWRFEFMR